MTKMEMINRMIILGCLKEKHREEWLQKEYKEIMRIYIIFVPRKLEQIKRRQNNG